MKWVRQRELEGFGQAGQTPRMLLLYSTAAIYVDKTDPEGRRQMEAHEHTYVHTDVDPTTLM